MKLGEKLKQIRELNQLNQVEMSELLFTSQSNISQYEKNERIPFIETLVRFITHFNLDANWLLGNANEQTINFNDQSTCNIAALKTENYYSAPTDRLEKMETNIEIILKYLNPPKQ